MKIILIIAALASLSAVLQAQELSKSVTVSGQEYTLYYRENVTYDDYESNIEVSFWAGSSATAALWAEAAAVANLRFAYDEYSFGGNPAINYRQDGDSGATGALQNATANYAIYANSAPAPIPLLGILPVVGFLRKMRKRKS